jgi:hypothetical protein
MASRLPAEANFVGVNTLPGELRAMRLAIRVSMLLGDAVRGMPLPYSSHICPKNSMFFGQIQGIPPRRVGDPVRTARATVPPTLSVSPKNIRFT